MRCSNLHIVLASNEQEPHNYYLLYYLLLHIPLPPPAAGHSAQIIDRYMIVENWKQQLASKKARGCSAYRRPNQGSTGTFTGELKLAASQHNWRLLYHVTAPWRVCCSVQLVLFANIF